MTRENIFIDEKWKKLSDYIIINPDLLYSIQNQSTVTILLTEDISEPIGNNKIGLQLGYNESCIYKKNIGDLYIKSTSGISKVGITDNE